MINSRNFAIVLLAVVLQSTSSFSTTSTTSTTFGRSRFVTSSVLASSSTSTSTDFSTFADSLESSLDHDDSETSTTTTSATPTLTMEKPWQAKLDDLLDPMTNLADRQILLSELLTSNDKIRDDVLDALSNRKIDSLLTPTQKKLQDGTRAVVRQLANDILPQISQSAAEASGSSSSSSKNTPSLPFFPPAAPTPADMQSIGNRLFSVVSNQIQKNLEELQEDLTDPINKIPARLEKQRDALEKQRDDVLKEARNVFLEKPEGLEEPSYTVVKESDLYEIRSYEAYSMASTSMSSSKTDDNAALEGMAAGSAFNTLASYIFGANDLNKPMDMTTPVTTTSAGDMRFYVKTIDGRIPQPKIDSSSDSIDNNNQVEIVQIPAALLAIRKFAGFATDGEVARQKDTLLQALEMDNVDLDVAHGVIVPHVVFQYNPPYTLPMVRRNEIGVPVRKIGQSDDEDETKTISLKEEWVVDDESDDDDDDTSPSDVE